MTELQDIELEQGDSPPRYNDGVDLTAMQHKLIHDMSESVLFSQPQTKRGRRQPRTAPATAPRTFPPPEDEMQRQRRQYMDRYFERARDLKVQGYDEFGLPPKGHKTLGLPGTSGDRHKPEAGKPPNEEE